MDKPGELLVKWQDSFSVRDPLMDSQHQIIFNLLNRIFLASREGEKSAIPQEIFVELVRYTQVHFTSEERLLEQINYPQLSEHRELHWRMIYKTLDFYFHDPSGDADFVLEMLHFLKSWWTGHILHEDQKYSSYAAQHPERPDSDSTPAR